MVRLHNSLAMSARRCLPLLFEPAHHRASHFQNAFNTFKKSTDGVVRMCVEDGVLLAFFCFHLGITARPALFVLGEFNLFLFESGKMKIKQNGTIEESRKKNEHKKNLARAFSEEERHECLLPSIHTHVYGHFSFQERVPLSLPGFGRQDQATNKVSIIIMGWG